jgi:hypothetical protein
VERPGRERINHERYWKRGGTRNLLEPRLGGAPTRAAKAGAGRGGEGVGGLICFFSRNRFGSFCHRNHSGHRQDDVSWVGKSRRASGHAIPEACSPRGETARVPGRSSRRCVAKTRNRGVGPRVILEAGGAFREA